MRVIAHRGNLNGPVKETENTLDSIFKCFETGLDVEIDIHVKNSYIYLDHDGILNNALTGIFLSQFLNIFSKNKDKLWVHCKNLEALIFCQEHLKEYNFFGHKDDDFVLTSKGFIFTKPGISFGKNVVCVMPELVNFRISEVKKYDIVLTDFPLLYI